MLAPAPAPWQANDNWRLRRSNDVLTGEFGNSLKGLSGLSFFDFDLTRSGHLASEICESHLLTTELIIFYSKQFPN